MSERKWVCDASPIILLGKTGCTDLLLFLSDELVVPKSVELEVRDGPAESPARSWLRERRSQYTQRAISVRPEVAFWELGGGESAALARVLQNPEWTVVMDDRVGRRCGEAVGISLTGTLGVLLLAKEEEHVSEVEPVIDALVDAGLQASDALLEMILRQAEEFE